MVKKMVEVSHRVEFDGDIMITDPVYVCSDWMRGVPGGIVRDTIYGDWGCTAYDMTGHRRRTPHGDETKLGSFCADSGMVCVCPLETAEACGGEKLAVLRERAPWCFTVIRGFKGTVEFRVYDETYKYRDKSHAGGLVEAHGRCLEVHGHGTRNGETFRFIGLQTSL